MEAEHADIGEFAIGVNNAVTKSIGNTLYDEKIGEMRQAFGEIGDMRLHVMAALMVADEVHELKQRLAKLETDLAATQGNAGAADERLSEVEDRAAEALVAAAERIEGVARSLIPTAVG